MESSDDAIAVVDQSGKVTGVKEGTVTLQLLTARGTREPQRLPLQESRRSPWKSNWILLRQLYLPEAVSRSPQPEIMKEA